MPGPKRRPVRPQRSRNARDAYLRKLYSRGRKVNPSTYHGGLKSAWVAKGGYYDTPAQRPKWPGPYRPKYHARPRRHNA